MSSVEVVNNNTIPVATAPVENIYRTYDGQNEIVMRTYRDMITK
jgi:hypothetical protein